MSAAYSVVSPACSVHLATGAWSLLYKGAVLPEAADLHDGEAARLLEGGFVEKVAEPKAEPVKAEPKKS